MTRGSKCHLVRCSVPVQSSDALLRDRQNCVTERRLPSLRTIPPQTLQQKHAADFLRSFKTAVDILQQIPSADGTSDVSRPSERRLGPPQGKTLPQDERGVNTKLSLRCSGPNASCPVETTSSQKYSAQPLRGETFNNADQLRSVQHSRGRDVSETPCGPLNSCTANKRQVEVQMNSDNIDDENRLRLAKSILVIRKLWLQLCIKSGQLSIACQRLTKNDEDTRKMKSVMEALVIRLVAAKEKQLSESSGSQDMRNHENFISEYTSPTAPSFENAYSSSYTARRETSGPPSLAVPFVGQYVDRFVYHSGNVRKAEELNISWERGNQVRTLTGSRGSARSVNSVHYEDKRPYRRKILPPTEKNLGKILRSQHEGGVSQYGFDKYGRRMSCSDTESLRRLSVTHNDTTKSPCGAVRNGSEGVVVNVGQAAASGTFLSYRGDSPQGGGASQESVTSLIFKTKRMIQQVEGSCKNLIDNYNENNDQLNFFNEQPATDKLKENAANALDEMSSFRGRLNELERNFNRILQQKLEQEMAAESEYSADPNFDAASGSSDEANRSDTAAAPYESLGSTAASQATIERPVPLATDSPPLMVRVGQTAY